MRFFEHASSVPHFRTCLSGDASAIMSDAQVWWKDVCARRSSFIDTALCWSDGEREVIVRFMFARSSNPVCVAVNYLTDITYNQCFTDIEIADAVTWRRLFDVDWRSEVSLATIVDKPASVVYVLPNFWHSSGTTLGTDAALIPLLD